MYWIMIGDLSTKHEKMRIYQTLVTTPLKALVIIAKSCLFDELQLSLDIPLHIFQQSSLCCSSAPRDRLATLQSRDHYCQTHCLYIGDRWPQSIVHVVAKFSNLFFLANPKPPLYSVTSFPELIDQAFVKLLYIHQEGFEQ